MSNRIIELAIKMTREGSTNELLAELNELIELTKTLDKLDVKTNKEFTKLAGKKIGALKRINAELAKSVKLLKETSDSKMIIKETQAIDKLTAKQIKLKTQLSKAARLQTIELEQQSKAQQKINNKEKESVGLISNLQKKVKQLKVDQKFAKTKNELEKVNKALKQTQLEIKTFQKVGVQSTNTFGNALDSFAFKFNFLSDIASTATFAIADALKKGVVGAITKTVELEFALSRLEAISGATKEEMAALEKDARKLGETTQFTAAEVVGLQNAFARLGFTTTQILESTAAAIDLATIESANLTRTAQITAETLRGFGLETSEVNRVVDVMAASFSGSALNLEKFSVSASIVAPVAAQMGFEIEGVTALLGSLVDAGFDASRAGTSLRNIFLNLADSGSDLSQELGFQIKSTGDLTFALSDLNKRWKSSADVQDKVAKALELTDKRSVAAFARFIEGADAISKFEDTLDQAEDISKSMADIMRDNLATATKELESATSELQIELGSSLTPTIRDVVTLLIKLVRSLKANKNSIINTAKLIATLTTAFITFKATVALSTVKVAFLSTKVGGLTRSLRVLFATMRANPLGLFLGVLSAVIAKFVLFSDEAEEAADSQDKFNTAVGRGIDLYAKAERAAGMAQGKMSLQAESLTVLAKAQAILNKEIENYKPNKPYGLPGEDWDFIVSRHKRQQKARIEAIKWIQKEIDARRLRSQVSAADAADARDKLKLLAKLEKLRLELIIRASDARIAIIEDDENRLFQKEKERFARESQMLEEKYAKLIEIEPTKRRELDSLLEDLEDKHKMNLKEIRDKAEKKRRAEKLKELSDKQDVLDNEAKLERIKLLEKLNNETLTRDEFALNELKQQEDLLKKKIKLQKEYNEKATDLELELAELQAVIKAKADQDAIDARNALIDSSKLALDGVLDGLKERTAEEERQLSERLAFRQNLIADEERAAAEGRENNLAAEKRKNKELEKERSLAQRKQERIAKAEAFFNLFTQLSKTGNASTAAVQALVQVQLASVIAGTFGDGGMVRDGINGGIKDGIFHGDRHSDRSGGVIIQAEKDEGILSVKEMKNLGVSNFYDLKDRLKDPVTDLGAFGEQNAAFVAAVPVSGGNSMKGVISKLDELEQTIKNKPVTTTNIDNLGNLVTQIVENNTQRTIRKVNRRF